MRSKNKKLSARNKELVHQLQSLQSIQARLQELEEENAALEAQNKKLEDNIAELLTKDVGKVKRRKFMGLIPLSSRPSMDILKTHVRLKVEISFTVKSLENLKGLVSDGTKLSVHWTKGKSEGVVPPAVVVDGKVEWQTGVSSILCHLLKNKTTHEVMKPVCFVFTIMKNLEDDKEEEFAKCSLYLKYFKSECQETHETLFKQLVSGTSEPPVFKVTFQSKWLQVERGSDYGASTSVYRQETFSDSGASDAEPHPPLDHGADAASKSKKDTVPLKRSESERVKTVKKNIPLERSESAQVKNAKRNKQVPQ